MLLLALAFFGLFLGAAQADNRDVSSVSLHTPRPTMMLRLGVKSPQNTALSSRVLALVNQARTEQGLAPLKLHGVLTRVAIDHGMEMEALGYFSHLSPTQGLATPALRVQKSGLKAGLAGENIFTAQNLAGEELAQAVVENWLNTPQDRSNLMDPRATHMGIAVLEYSGRATITGLLAGDLN